MHIEMTVTSPDPRREEIGATCAAAIKERYGTLRFTLEVHVLGLAGETRGRMTYKEQGR